MTDRYTFPPRHEDAAVPPLGERLLPGEVAAMIGVTEGTLRNWRSKRRGPAYYQLGRILYWRRDVEKWIASQRVEGNRW